MEKLKVVASYICMKYQKEYGTKIDEMKLHKILYFSQREYLIQNDCPLFENTFYGWKYGPVLKEIRKFYREDMLNEKNTLSSSSVEVLDKVFKKYSPKDSWSLSILTHGEISWQKSRIGIPEGENGDNAMKLSDIKLDAERIKQRRLMRKQFGLA